MADRLLLRGGTVLTVDPDLGDLPTGDVLIEGDTIAQVAPQIDADAEVVDASGKIVIPGFVDTHRHTWEAAIRGCAPNATLGTYFVEVLDSFAPTTGPRTSTPATWPGRWSASTPASRRWSTGRHINSPEHPDAGIRGLQEAGIRAQYAYGSANTSLNDYWNNSIAIPADDVRRVRDTYFSSDDGLLTMALATRGRPTATTTWSRRSGRWPARSASPSPSTWPCTPPAASAWSSSSATWACSARTPPTSTAAT